MFCPRCHKELVIAEAPQHIEIDYCPSCRGSWLEQDELSLMMEARNLRDEEFTLSSHPQSSETKLHCPECNKLMEKKQSGVVTLDVCPHGCGIWFDDKELHYLTDALS